MSWRKITFVVVALIVLLGGAAALSQLFISMKPEPPRRPEMELKRSVKAEEIQYADIYSPLTLEGRVVSGSEVMLVSEAAGKIEQGNVALRPGNSFKKGQLLAEIYKDEVELALKARKSRFLTTMTSLLPDLKIDFPQHLDAYEMFFRAIDMEEDLPEMPVVRDEKLKVFLASRNVFSEYYGIKQDESRLRRHSLYAPFNGTFTQVNFEVGAYVNPGSQIAKMIRTDHIEVEVPVPNKDSEWIKIGDKVTVISSNGETRPGVVVRKSDFIVPQTQSRSVYVDIKNSGTDEILTGEYKLVKFPGQEIQQAMEIPRSAVFNTNVVFTVEDSRLKKTKINILKVNETTLIFNGVEEGKQVVIEPLINVKENTPVAIMGEEQTRKSNSGDGSKPENAVKNTATR
jgi:multidrug efflux pump subunit AcrA (membrane-fusion protein)